MEGTQEMRDSSGTWHYIHTGCAQYIHYISKCTPKKL